MFLPSVGCRVGLRVYVFSGVRQQYFAGMGFLLAHLKIKMRQQTLTLIFLRWQLKSRILSPACLFPILHVGANCRNSMRQKSRYFPWAAGYPLAGGIHPAIVLCCNCTGECSTCAMHMNAPFTLFPLLYILMYITH